MNVSEERDITERDIFHYTYAVLHDPVYREKYALNLKREFPRVPFYEDFAQWAMWGERLMDLHLNYETVEPYPLRRLDRERVTKPKPRLKADKEAGQIVVDTKTTLSGVPPEAWAYVLGTRTALEWVLERHRERQPRDLTVREKFNTYRLADHKERLIDLLMRVTTVSVETARITKAMVAEGKR